MKETTGKILFGLVFCVVLPALLFVWARALDALLPTLPSVGGGPGAWLLVVLGGGLLLGGMRDLWVLGGGLPMNAYPPPRYVAGGSYRWLPHPIYVGFAALMPGAFALAGLSAGVWIVSPVIWLGTVTLVIGYERIDLERRFGRNPTPPRLALPPDTGAAPQWWHRAAVYGLAFGPWLVAYLGLARLPFGGRWETYLPFEHAWPPCASLLPVYLAAWAWVAGAPLAATSQAALRRLIRDGWLGAAIILWCDLVFPWRGGPRGDAGSTLWPEPLSAVLPAETDGGVFPSAHVFWVLLAARAWAGRMPAVVAYGLGGVLAASGVAAGQHSLLSALAGGAVFGGVLRAEAWWRWMLRATEWVANSWHDWRRGGVRLINHGGYVAAAAGAGLWLVGWLLGPRHTTAVLIIAGGSLLGAGIWAQLLESSSGLSRPFGYYGGIFGGWLAVAAVHLWNGEGWVLMGAFAVISPLVQGLGRLRCLVQGCCHGRPCADHLGIRYRHPVSRVCKLARLGGQPVYPTPLYSILGNVVIQGLLLRLWCSGAALGFIFGSALILTACARFMEEGYRGEPQTVRFGGLAIYHWLALGFVITGAVAMAVPTPPAPPISPAVFAPLWFAVPFGLVVWFAMGVDFPDSHRRFSRLA